MTKNRTASRANTPVDMVWDLQKRDRSGALPFTPVNTYGLRCHASTAALLTLTPEGLVTAHGNMKHIMRWKSMSCIRLYGCFASSAASTLLVPLNDSPASSLGDVHFSPSAGTRVRFPVASMRRESSAEPKSGSDVVRE